MSVFCMVGHTVETAGTGLSVSRILNGMWSLFVSHAVQAQLINQRSSVYAVKWETKMSIGCL